MSHRATIKKPPTLDGLVESSLYVDDLERSALFYESVLGLVRMVAGERLIAMAVPGRQVLLLCRKGASPDHDGDGRLHVAFAVSSAALDAWEAWLTEKRIVIVDRRSWPGGGRSLYFRDPDGHLVECVTPGTWENY